MSPEISFRCYLSLVIKVFFLILLIHVTYFKKELRALNRELQLHILELADVLVERPSQYAKESGRDISDIQELAPPTQFFASSPGSSHTYPYSRTSDTAT
ncbi:hypothetical protein RND71_031753 [Anisodus tanguticus]|uniref:Uncharacterized protein n=1 Tax=Anisodus tanguticus TaxID=243964 RepID=A0AAE1UXS4_9SOLA|nr:hypothetical protein RND71_031753 [Anisodus tanguticus]